VPVIGSLKKSRYEVWLKENLALSFRVLTDQNAIVMTSKRLKSDYYLVEMDARGRRVYTDSKIAQHRIDRCGHAGDRMGTDPSY
jgi:hypothetical protein